MTVYIRDQAIIQCSSLLCTLLSPEDSGHGWLLVGSPIWAYQYQVTNHVMTECRAILQSSMVAASHLMSPSVAATYMSSVSEQGSES